jgi:hypothetical protein
MERYGVQAYLCGHEHNLQYLHVEGERTHYFVSGGGSQCSSYGFVESDSRPDLKLFHYGSGMKRLSHVAVCTVCISIFVQGHFHLLLRRFSAGTAVTAETSDAVLHCTTEGLIFPC